MRQYSESAHVADHTAVHLYNEDTPLAVIELLAPDVLVTGADYKIDDIVGAPFVLSRGGKVLRFELVPSKSTTNIIDKASLKSPGAS